jgi:hypothetical protein
MTRRSGLGRDFMLASTALVLALCATRIAAQQAPASANIQQAIDAIKADKTAEGLDAVHRDSPRVLDPSPPPAFSTR